MQDPGGVNDALPLRSNCFPSLRLHKHTILQVHSHAHTHTLTQFLQGGQTPPPWPNSKTQVPFEAKGLMKFPEVGSADPFLPCPALSWWQGYSHSGPPRQGSALGLSLPPPASFILSRPISWHGRACWRRFPAALSRSPPLTPIPRLGPQPWGLDTC